MIDIRRKIVQRTAIVAATLAMGASASLVSAPSVMASPASVTAMPCKPGKYYQVYRGAGVNIRSGPSTSHRSLGHLYKNDWGKKVDSKRGWIKLKLGKRSKSGLPKGTTGWVASTYLSDCVPTQTS
ncbi:SH3 domain-containing protein [Streptomyces sp. NBC_01304]|uniref:SH3 domain-containing protein n=1 Tax=Streptomyces sp. NBC_01304 TaxID=2903818 RepID=UPI002E0E3E44|nr:SH3 domain-containing protein [Streptomyces sp. NBC_01304]